MVTKDYEKGKGFRGKDELIQRVSEEKQILTPEERAELYIKLQKEGRLNFKDEE
jgi:hypothetical protein